MHTRVERQDKAIEQQIVRNEIKSFCIENVKNVQFLWSRIGGRSSDITQLKNDCL